MALYTIKFFEPTGGFSTAKNGDFAQANDIAAKAVEAGLALRVEIRDETLKLVGHNPPVTPIDSLT